MFLNVVILRKRSIDTLPLRFEYDREIPLDLMLLERTEISQSEQFFYMHFLFVQIRFHCLVHVNCFYNLS